MNLCVQPPRLPEVEKMVTHMLYLVLAVGFKYCRNYLCLFEEVL